MSWNNGHERKKFEEKQKKQADYYRSIGMAEEQIQAMYEFDLEAFKGDRRFYIHAQSFGPKGFNGEKGDEEKLSVCDLFPDTATTGIEASTGYSRYWWIEEIDDPELAKRVKSLSKSDLELITKVAFDEMTHEQIGEINGTTKQAVTDKIARIRKKLRNS